MHKFTKQSIVIIQNLLDNTPVQFITKESLAKEIADKTNKECSTQTARRILKGMGLTLKQLQVKARNKRVEEILIQRKGKITIPEMQSIIISEGFKFDRAHMRDIIRATRKENNLKLPRLKHKEDVEKLTNLVIEAIDHIENKDLAITTNPKISYYIIKKYEILLSTWQIRKIRKLMDESFTLPLQSS